MLNMRRPADIGGERQIPKHSTHWILGGRKFRKVRVLLGKAECGKTKWNSEHSDELSERPCCSETFNMFWRVKDRPFSSAPVDTEWLEPAFMEVSMSPTFNRDTRFILELSSSCYTCIRASSMKQPKSEIVCRERLKRILRSLKMKR